MGAAEAFAHREVGAWCIAVGTVRSIGQMAVVLHQFEEEGGFEGAGIGEAGQMFQVDEQKLVEGGCWFARKLRGEERFGKRDGGLEMVQIFTQLVVGVQGRAVLEGVEVGAADRKVVFGLGEGRGEGEQMGPFAVDALDDQADQAPV